MRAKFYFTLIPVNDGATERESDSEKRLVQRAARILHFSFVYMLQSTIVLPNNIYPLLSWTYFRFFLAT